MIAGAQAATHSPLPHTMRADKRIGAAFILLIIMGSLVNSLAIVGLVSVLPEISAHFSATPNAPALTRGLITVVSVALVLGAPAAGIMIERFGLRRVLLTAITTFTVSGTAGFFIDDIWLLLASRVVLGFADAFVGTLIIALIVARLDPDRRNRWIGWYTFAGSVGSLIFIPLSGVIAQFGWRYIFLLHTIGLPILISAMIAVGRDDMARAAHRSAEPNPRRWIHWPLGLVLFGIAAGAIENTTHLFLPFHLTEIGDSSPDRIAQALLPIALGGAISAFLYGYIRNVLSVGWTFVAAFAASGVSLLCLGLAQSYPMIILGAACVGLSVGVLAPNINVYAASYGDPAHQARHIGIARGGFFAGAPIAQIMLEPVSGSAGAGAAIAALGCAAFLLMTAPLIQRRRMAG